jgi:hypothetical protein
MDDETSVASVKYGGDEKCKQNPEDLTCDWTRAAELGNKRITTWDTTLLFLLKSINCN